MSSLAGSSRDAVETDSLSGEAALGKFDNADFSWYHLKVCLVAGVGFFTDSYDLFSINIASTMLGYLYGTELDSVNNLPILSTQLYLVLNIAAPVGTLVGQLVFGWLADLLGRKRMYGIELMIIIVATFGQAVSGSGVTVNIIGILAAWRFVMGIGIGGDYPVSAVISSEFASTRIRGRMMTTVFSSQGWGNFTATVIAIILVAGYKDASREHIDKMWRLLIGLGCIPGVIALYFRLTIPETPRFTMDIKRNVDQVYLDFDKLMGVSEERSQHVEVTKAPELGFFSYFSKWENLKLLIGTSYSWFALDIAFYGLGLNSSKILQFIKFYKDDTTPDQYRNLQNICRGNLILSSALLPGYFVSFLFIDSWGRKPIQLMGFSMLTILFLIMGFAFNETITQRQGGGSAFLFLYCLVNFFQNFGPNTTTFIYPGELFPTRFRSTCHGISAASGKLGAIIAQAIFAKSLDNKTDIFLVLKVFAFVMLSGVGSTLLLPETKRKTLEEISPESAETQEGYEMGTRQSTES